MATLKAWVALMALVVTALLSSDVLPITGTWHNVLVIASVVLGSVATWWAPNKPDSSYHADVPPQL